MSDYLTAFLGFFLQTEHQLWLMFFSSFLSSTLLPGNSEIVFGTLAVQTDTPFLLWFIATLGNSLGSLTTYAMARLIPPPNFVENTSKKTAYAIKLAQQYGAYSLLLSWLPLLGDVLCGVAGWLRLPLWQTALCITLGKGARYALIGWGIWHLWG